MTLSISNDTKNALTVTNEGKTISDQAFSDRTDTFAETGPGGNTFGVPGVVIERETKNTIIITNETKT